MNLSCTAWKMAIMRDRNPVTCRTSPSGAIQAERVSLGGFP